MEKLTLTLHKTKDTKNKVVYGTKDGDVIQSVYIDKDALGDVTTGHAPGGHNPAVSPGSLPGWGTAPGRRAGENEVKRTAGGQERETVAEPPAADVPPRPA